MRVCRYGSQRKERQEQQADLRHAVHVRTHLDEEQNDSWAILSRFVASMRQSTAQSAVVIMDRLGALVTGLSRRPYHPRGAFQA
jgi:hypothetical protein